MLPGLADDRPGLTDVLRSCLDALRDADQGPLELGRASNVIVVMVDGLGAQSLAARAGHARVLTSDTASGSVIQSGFPTTTAAALPSLTTGTRPGRHGMVGYSVLEPDSGRLMNQLSGWGSVDPLTWQDQPTIFEVAAGLGFDPVVVGPTRYRDSPFTRAVLRGARYVPAESIEQRFEAAVHASGSAAAPALVYLYVPELDKIGHARGWQSEEWTTALEGLDATIATALARLRRGDGMLVTADHGMIDVPQTSHVLLGDEVLEGVRFVGGEPRCVQLYLHPGADAGQVLQTVRAAEEGRSWVVSRAEAIEADWFGPIRDDAVRARIGDVLIAARKSVAYYDGRLPAERSRSMVGQHGSWSPAEMNVPLVRLGAFAR